MNKMMSIVETRNSHTSESGLQYNIIYIIITVVGLILSRNDLLEARPQEDNMTNLKKTKPLYLFKANKNRHEKGTGRDSFGLFYLDLS